VLDWFEDLNYNLDLMKKLFDLNESLEKDGEN